MPVMAKKPNVTLWGVGEIVDAYEVDKSTVRYWRSKPGFPAPLADLKQGPVWDAEAVMSWKLTGIRKQKRPGPKAKR